LTKGIAVRHFLLPGREKKKRTPTMFQKFLDKFKDKDGKDDKESGSKTDTSKRLGFLPNIGNNNNAAPSAAAASPAGATSATTATGAPFASGATASAPTTAGGTSGSKTQVFIDLESQRLIPAMVEMVALYEADIHNAAAVQTYTTALAASRAVTVMDGCTDVMHRGCTAPAQAERLELEAAVKSFADFSRNSRFEAAARQTRADLARIRATLLPQAVPIAAFGGGGGGGLGYRQPQHA
jgi:hypothetical protein